jgi:hypothetical protein
MAGFDLSGYVEVADRLREWYEKNPTARIVTTIVEQSEKRVTVKAEVFRKADDVLPAGVGHSALGVPGTTPYTRGAELENAETSAIGRALVAAGLPSKKVASADEVLAKRGAADAQIARAATEIFSAQESAIETVILTDNPVAATGAQIAAGRCPVHGRDWTFKEGTSKAGKAYAFWSCGAKDENYPRGWCDEKPSKAWEVSQEARR